MTTREHQVRNRLEARSRWMSKGVDLERERLQAVELGELLISQWKAQGLVTSQEDSEPPADQPPPANSDETLGAS